MEAEGQAVLQFSSDNAIVSLSGSNPMHKEAMEHIKSLGIVVYLDVDDDEILNRLAAMKVNRIVGQNEGRVISFLRDTPYSSVIHLLIKMHISEAN